MPHATMKLIPGIDTYKTPALNEAAFSKSQLIRFVPDRSGMGLIQKMGGWVQWATQVTPNINELHPWEDLNTNKRLAVGANDSISYIEYNDATNTAGNQIFITPEETSSDSPVETSTVTFTNASPTVVTAGVSLSGASCVGTALTTTGSPALLVGMTILSSGSISLGKVVSGSANSWVVSIGGTYTSQTMTATIGKTAPGTPLVFSGGSLPTGVTAGTVYYIATSPAPTLTTFRLSTTIGSAANVNTTSTGSGTATVPFASTTSGSSTVTIFDTGLGVQTVTFTSASPTVVTAAVTPIANTEVVFSSTLTVPTGMTAGISYYVLPLTGTTFNLSTTPSGAADVNTTTAGTGTITMYAPDQIRGGFSVWIQTPISVANLYITGLYQVVSYTASAYYNIYTIDVGTVATSTTGVATLPSFDPTNGTSLVEVEQANHPYQQDGYTATFLTSTTSAGLTIYGNYFTTYVSSTKYQITSSSAATSDTAFLMNGGSAHYQYYFNIPSAFAAAGYGANPTGYGGGGYGAGEPLIYPSAPTITTTDWVINNFGEILTANSENGPLYYWSPSQNTSTAFLLETAPLTNTGHFIAMPSRQIVAYGSTVTGIQDPLLIRWSDAGDATVWQASANNQAGSFRIAEGSMIVAGIQSSQQALIWTDLAVWAMQYVGYPNVFGFNKLADGVGLIAKKAVGILGRATYWMSPGGFNVLADGGPQDMACPVWDQIFQNLNTNYVNLIRCATNSIFDEVTWYYPSINATYNDSYVKYNTTTQAWDYGLLDRVAWCDQSVLGSPIGADNNGYIWQHEIGYNAGNSPMVSSFETGYMQLNDADSLIFIDQIWPDFKWQTTAQQSTGSSTSATMYLTFYGADYPGDTPTQYGPYTMNQQTQYLSVRIRNRLLRISCSTANAAGVATSGTFFRIGALRYRAQMDGKF